MIIRDITPNDKESILRLAEMFFNEILIPKAGIHFDAQHASAHFDTLINTPGVLALCVEKENGIRGMVAGVSSAIIFAKELAMQEMVWYVEPKYRNCGLKLLLEFEKRSKERGLDQMMMVGVIETPVLDLYPRLGYKENQRIFIKNLR